MLVLTRKPDQSIVLKGPLGPNETIRVIVCEIDRNKVRLGVEAPRSVAVDREEIYLAKENERGEEEARQIEEDEDAQG